MLNHKTPSLFKDKTNTTPFASNVKKSLKNKNIKSIVSDIEYAPLNVKMPDFKPEIVIDTAPILKAARSLPNYAPRRIKQALDVQDREFIPEEFIQVKSLEFEFEGDLKFDGSELIF